MASSRKRDNQGKTLTGGKAEAVSLRRRRLLKGAAAAAPGIFTLYSGNAQAMLSTHHCPVQSRDAFTGEQEFAGEEQVVDGFVRLVEGPGIHVVREVPAADPATAPGNSALTPSNLAANPGQLGDAQDRWLIMVPDSTGAPHYLEVGYTAGNSAVPKPGITWNDSLNGAEWLPAPDSGSGVPGSPLRFIDPDSNPNSPVIYVQEFSEVKSIQALACIDDSGNIVSAFPQDCDALGLAPPSGSCWTSIGSMTMDTWWG